MTKPTKESLDAIDKKIKSYNKSSIATSVSARMNVKDKETVEATILRTNLPKHVKAFDLTEGKQLNGTKEWINMVNDNLSEDKDRGKLIYSATVDVGGQPYPKGSIIVTYFHPTEGSKDILLDLGQNENSTEFLQDRARAAYNSNNGQPGGMVTYGEHQFLVLDKKDANGQYVIGHFINGKPAGQ